MYNDKNLGVWDQTDCRWLEIWSITSSISGKTVCAVGCCLLNGRNREAIDPFHSVLRSRISKNAKHTDMATVENVRCLVSVTVHALSKTLTSQKQ